MCFSFAVIKTPSFAASGRIRWKSAMVTINHALEGELIGIEPGDGMRRPRLLDDEQQEPGLKPGSDRTVDDSVRQVELAAHVRIFV
jgi:hypothetical protein